MTAATAPRRTQLVLTHGAHSLITVAAAARAGLLGPAEHRVLVLSDDSPAPELGSGPESVHGLAVLSSAFDEVVSYNSAIAPYHPSGWLPRDGDEPLLERYFRMAWRLGDSPVDLLVNHLHEPPARTLAQAFASARIECYSAALAGYGPTGILLPDAIGSRIHRVLHLDLLPGLHPRLLAEWQPRVQSIGLDALRAVAQDCAAGLTELPERPYALIIGQDLAALGLDRPRRAAAYRRMLAAAARLGLAQAVFLPHASTSDRALRKLREAGAELGVDCRVERRSLHPDQVMAARRPALVLGASGAGLHSAVRTWGVPAATIADPDLAAGVTPWSHPERLGVLLAARLLPAVEDVGLDAVDPAAPMPPQTAALIDALAWSQQPTLQPGLRDDALAFVRAEPGLARRYLPHLSAVEDPAEGFEPERGRRPLGRLRRR